MNLTTTETNIGTIATNSSTTNTTLGTINTDTSAIGVNGGTMISQLTDVITHTETTAASTEASNVKLITTNSSLGTIVTNTGTTNTTLGTISGKLPSALGNNPMTNSLSINIASDDTMKTRNFNMRKHYDTTDEKTYEIFCRFTDFTESTINTDHDQLLGVAYNWPNIDTTISAASSATTDTSYSFQITGYNAVGTPVTDTLFMNGANSQTPATTTNSFWGITNITYNNVTRTYTGDIGFARTGTTFNSGVPDDYMARILAGFTVNRAYFSRIQIPIDKDLVIYEVEITHIGQTENTQLVELVKTYINPSIYPQPVMVVKAWKVSYTMPSIYHNYDGGLIVEGFRSGFGESAYFRINGMTSSPTDSIEIRCRFGFISTT